MLMPLSLREWVPRTTSFGLSWAPLEMDLSAVYGAYPADGHGRPAYEPKMMVAFTLYAYASGNRSSRAIERACTEDVAYRVSAQSCARSFDDRGVPKASRVRAGGPVLRRFFAVRRGRALEVGVVAVDGTKVPANASNHNNVDYERMAREILAEAERIDAKKMSSTGRARRRAARGAAHSRRDAAPL